MSIDVVVTPMWRFGRPPSKLSSAETNSGKFVRNVFCLSCVERELSITNRMSISRLVGIVLVTSPDCDGGSSETERLGQPASNKHDATKTARMFVRVARADIRP